MPTAQVPSVSREEPESEEPSPGRNSRVSKITGHQPFSFWTRQANRFQNLMRPGMVC